MFGINGKANKLSMSLVARVPSTLLACARAVIISVSLICMIPLQAMQYELVDIGDFAPDVRKSYATSINERGQVGGVLSPNLLWFFWDPVSGLTPVPVSRTKSHLGPGCPPYIGENGVLSDQVVNELGDTAYVLDSGLYLSRDNSVSLIDDSNTWQSEGASLRMNGRAGIAGTVRLAGGKASIKYVDLKTGGQYFSPIKYSCSLVDMNRCGDIVGFFQTPDSLTHCLFWRPGNEWMIIENFRPSAINDHGVIVGQRGKKGAIWDHGVVYDLDSLLGLYTDMSQELETIELITDINNAGQMVGWGTIGNGPPAVIRAVVIYATP